MSSFPRPNTKFWIRLSDLVSVFVPRGSWGAEVSHFELVVGLDLMAKPLQTWSEHLDPMPGNFEVVAVQWAMSHGAHCTNFSLGK